MRKVIGATVALALAALGASAVPSAHAATLVAPDETRVEALVNAARQSKGLAGLVRNDQLVQMAREQSVRQAGKGSIFHNPDLGGEITRRSLNWLKVGENVGMGPNVDLIEDAFLKSPRHYENIVDPRFDAIGVGVVDGADGRRYVTQVFADLATPAPQGTSRPAPVKAAPPARTARGTAGARPPAATASSPVAQRSRAPLKPSIQPNVVVGGVVEPLDLADPRSDQAKRSRGRIEAPTAGPLGRYVDFVTFWS